MTVTMEKIYEELKRIEDNMVTKRDLESLRDTIEILSNPDTMKQISESLDDIQKGKVKKISSVKDLLSE